LDDVEVEVAAIAKARLPVASEVVAGVVAGDFLQSQPCSIHRRKERIHVIILSLRIFTDDKKLRTVNVNLITRVVPPNFGCSQNQMKQQCCWKKCGHAVMLQRPIDHACSFRLLQKEW
jgi:hypothetical protein